MLITAMLRAPLISVDPTEPGVFHAMDMGGVAAAWPDGPGVAVCGAENQRLVDAGDRTAVEWPPRIASLGDRQRCRACHVGTGFKRPRSAFQVTHGAE